MNCNNALVKFCLVYFIARNFGGLKYKDTKICPVIKMRRRKKKIR